MLGGENCQGVGCFQGRNCFGIQFPATQRQPPTFQARWNTKNLHGINWSSGKLEYIELSSIIHHYCSPTTEYFAKGLEKCNLLSNYLCKDVENLDDLGCPKVSKLPNNLDTDWDCSNYPYRHEKSFHCAEKKAYAFGIWTLDHSDNV